MPEPTHKAMNKTQIANYFGVSLYVLRQWLQPFLHKIGTYAGGCYTPKQVAIIIECLG
jgi:hypothetical protein